ncbi:ATP-grasp domain-containing protein [Streptomyces sp. NBC_00597]|uniref:ATP-grasp domain-containing protein n=1 Tax=Streptomyces sp. NBC_00597 TaxID=2975786 RepID=UPI0030E1A48B
MTGERERVNGTGRGPTAVLLSPRPAVVAAARRVGARTVVVAPGPPVPSDREGAERRVPADWRDHRRLVGAVGRLEAVRRGHARVFGFDPAAALAAARANEALGLPGTPAAAVTALMDKAALRARSNALHAARPVSFVRCGRAALLPFLAGLIGFPCVVKPRAGALGEGVRLLAGPAGAATAVRDYPEVTDLLVQEYLEGPELAVEAVSRGGRHRILGWTRRIPGPGTATTATGYDLPVALAAGTAEAVRALVRGVLDLAGHRDGPSHTEVVLTPHGPRLVEAHASPEPRSSSSCSASPTAPTCSPSPSPPDWACPTRCTTCAPPTPGCGTWTSRPAPASSGPTGDRQPPAPCRGWSGCGWRSRRARRYAGPRPARCTTPTSSPPPRRRSP